MVPSKKRRPMTRVDLDIRRAEREGRINGRYRCSACGMRYRNVTLAEECCGAKAIDTRVESQPFTGASQRSSPRVHSTPKSRRGAP